MSTGRICPCIKDNKENIARQSVWQNAGEWNRQGAAFAKKLSWFKLNAAVVIKVLGSTTLLHYTTITLSCKLE